MAVIPKRVACFYRVSTKGQMDGDDIPMQRRSCREFVDKQGWVVVKEYTEKGISGYKVSADDRDEIQRAKEDAKNKLFDVLLVFMFDRLGRIPYETPLVMKYFDKLGIELWSVQEQQQKFENDSDDLINFIRFWQAGGESHKTSMRVTEKHRQMTVDGIFRGGSKPYGYNLIKSGVINKKGKELLRMVIDDEQSKVVLKIYELVHEEGYGSNRITRYLNEENIKSATGIKWSTGAINFILKNPLYKGCMTFGKRKSDDGLYKTQSSDKWVIAEQVNLDIAIIDEKVWEKVQIIRSSRSPKNVKDDTTERFNVSKSPLLFVGSINCGHCGSPLTTTYNAKVYKLKDGTMKKWSQAKYRCSGKALNKTVCDGQTIYSGVKIENGVLEEINQYLEYLMLVDFENEIDKFKKSHINEEEKEIKQANKKLEDAYKELATLKAEVTKSILGQSAFKPEMLSGIIEDKEKDISILDNKVRKLEDSLKSKRIEVSEMEDLKINIPKWKAVYETGNRDKRKMMLLTIVDKITVYRDSIELDVKLKISQFINSVMGQYNQQTGESTLVGFTTMKYVEKSFKIMLSA